MYISACKLKCYIISYFVHSVKNSVENIHLLFLQLCKVINVIPFH